MAESPRKVISSFNETFLSMPLFAKLCLLVFLALIPRIIVFLQPQIITIDGTLYIKMAKLFSEGTYGGIPGSYFSLYSVLIFLVQKLVGDWELSGQLISLVSGTLTVIPVFLLGRSLYNEKIAWLSALFYITLPNLLKFSSQLIRDPVSWFLISTTLWLVWEGVRKNRPLYFCLASISAGLATLTRLEGFILWIGLAILIAVKMIPGISFKRRASNAVLILILFPLLLSLVLFSFEKSSKNVAMTEMLSFPIKAVKSNLSMVFSPQDPIDAMGREAYHSLPIISQDSLELASRHRLSLAVSEVIYKFIKSANFLIFLILLGFWKRIKQKMEYSDLYLSFAFLILVITSIFYTFRIFYFSTRHGVTLVLPLLFFGAHGLDFLCEILSKKFNRMTSGWAFTKRYLPSILTVFLIAVFLAQGLPGKGKEKVNIKETGIWLKEQGYQGSVIMGPKKFLRLAFYADGTFLEMPGSWERVVEAIQQKKVQVVVTDPSTIEQDCPGFLANWERSGLAPPRGRKGKRPSDTIQVYLVP